MSSRTQELLKQGKFTTKAHPKMAGDIHVANDDDPGCWNDMAVVLNRVKNGSSRSDDWDAPLDRKHFDVGEIKKRRGGRLYRLLVRTSNEVPGQLDLLHFGWKRPGKKGLEVQDGIIDEAFNRYMEIAAPKPEAGPTTEAQ